MKKKSCIAMLLAGGQGARLGALTKHIAKPAVSFGGKYRIIDFTLSNCTNSGIDTVGVLTQYRPMKLNAYIGNGSAWDLDEADGGVSILPPYATEDGAEWYKGTADAVYQNLDFIDIYNPDYVLILSGDHLYRMDYRKMLKSHIEKGAELTVSVMRVPWDEARHFGIITANEEGCIAKFTEKPRNPDSNLASMGVYIFNRKLLETTLRADSRDTSSEHDFGKNIIPSLLAAGKKLCCYEFDGYWKDVGTIDSYYETSMELLKTEPEFDLCSREAPAMSNSYLQPPHFIGCDASVKECLVSNGCVVLGDVFHSIISLNCKIGKGTVVRDSILLPGAEVRDGARVIRSILGENAVVKESVALGDSDPAGDITVVGNNQVVSASVKDGGQ